MKGGIIMITKEDALEDLEKIEKSATSPLEKVVVQVAKVLVKVLATIRSNQLLTEVEKAEIKARKVAQKAQEVKKEVK